MYSSRLGLSVMGGQSWSDPRDLSDIGLSESGDPPQGACARVLDWPEGRISVGVVDPADAPWALSRLTFDGEQRAWVQSPPHRGPFRPEPCGTVVVLNGWKESALHAAGWAAAASNLGFRAVVVDLIPFTGEPVARYTFGPAERRALRAALSALSADGTIRRPLIVWGYSLGAAAAMRGAGDGLGIDAVVAVGPFARLRAALEAGRSELPWYERWCLSAEAVDSAIATRTGRSSADEPAALAPQMRVPSLFVAGEADTFAPPAAVAAMAKSAPMAEFATVPGTHMELPWTSLSKAAEWVAGKLPDRRLLPLPRWRGVPVEPFSPMPGHPDFLIETHAPGEADISWVQESPLPMAWWFHPVTLDLGPVVAGGLKATCDGVPLAFDGRLNDPYGIRVRLPGWLAVGAPRILLTLGGGEPHRRMVGRLLGRGIVVLDPP
jgi:pimeloyl-ACP methyl ester carboxylesterase